MQIKLFTFGVTIIRTEEFKCCLLADKRITEDLYQAVVWVDDYALTHKGSFKKVSVPSGENVPTRVSGEWANIW